MSLKLKAFLKELQDADIYFELSNHRVGAISVLITVPGEKWEVDFLDDGSVDVELFVSNGEIRDEEALKDLFARFDERLLRPNATVRTARSQKKKSKEIPAGRSLENRAVTKV